MWLLISFKIICHYQSSSDIFYVASFITVQHKSVTNGYCTHDRGSLPLFNNPVLLFLSRADLSHTFTFLSLYIFFLSLFTLDVLLWSLDQSKVLNLCCFLLLSSLFPSLSAHVTAAVHCKGKTLFSFNAFIFLFEGFLCFFAKTEQEPHVRENQSSLELSMVLNLSLVFFKDCLWSFSSSPTSYIAYRVDKLSELWVISLCESTRAYTGKQW